MRREDSCPDTSASASPSARSRSRTTTTARRSTSRRRLQNLSRPEGVAVDTTVFEAAAARDAAIRQEFRHARVNLKGLGSTNVWVKRPFSWARALAPLGKAAAVLALPAIYLGLADLDVAVPGGDATRRFIDGANASLFRPLRSTEEIAEAASASRRTLTGLLASSITKAGWISGQVGKADDVEFDAWSSAQNVYALLRGGDLVPEDRRRALTALAYAFEPGQRIEAAGVPYGWSPHFGFDYTEAEPLLWTLAALARALGTPDLVAASEREVWLGRLGWVERAARLYRPDESGGWNIFPNQLKPEHHSPYSGALALLALLEVRDAGLPFEGSTARRDALIASTARHFVATFLADAQPPGWRRTRDPLDVVSSGLTLQIHGLLLRARAAGLADVPAAILDAIPRRLEALVGGQIDSASDAGEFQLEFVNHHGVKVRHNEAINFLWHPWAVETAWRWLADPPASAPKHAIVAVRRVLGHLVVDMASDAIRVASKGYGFVAAETLMGLSEIVGGR